MEVLNANVSLLYANEPGFPLPIIPFKTLFSKIKYNN